MDVIYRAFDGRIFYTDLDCLNYEKEMGLTSEKMGIYLDDKMRPLCMFEDGFFEVVAHMHIPTDEALSVLKKIGEGYNIPKEKGFWSYDWNEREWFDVEKRIQILKEDIQKNQRVIEILKGE